MRELFIKITRKFDSLIDENLQDVITKSGVSLVIKVFGVSFLFFNSSFLGRFLGPEGLGIINISLNLMLIPLYGIEGAAIATLSSICITIAIGQIRLSQYIDWQFNEIKLYLKLYLTQLLNILKSNYYGNFIRK